MNLHIEITIINDTDFNDNPITLKSAESFLDGRNIKVSITCENTVSDDDIKIQMRERLSALGFTWETED